MEHDLPPLPSGNPRPASLAWITNELLLETQNVWSKAYGKPVTEDEAIEILTNVMRLGEVLLKAERDISSRGVNLDALRHEWERELNLQVQP